MEVSPITRKHLTDELAVVGIRFHGALTPTEFVGRLFPIRELPSKDVRYSTMEQDIEMHCVNYPGDWSDSWVWTDDRLHLMDGDSKRFLEFLAEMVHPMVRHRAEDVESLLAIMNRHLANDGIEIAPAGMVHNRVTYGARAIAGGGQIAQHQPSLITLGAHVAQQVARLRKHDIDPFATIGAAKELVESVCKTVLRSQGMDYSKDDSLPQLAKATLELVELVPQGFAESDGARRTIQRLVAHLVGIPHCLAELRNMSGAGHGREASFTTLGPEYARLAADSAATFAGFLVSVTSLADAPAELPLGR